MMQNDVLQSGMWKTWIWSFAQVASGFAWEPYQYLRFTADKIQNTIIKGNGRLIINMPPRHGKSLLMSKWTPTWFLERWPEKRIIMTSYQDTYAESWGRKVRDEIERNDRIDVKLLDSSKKAGNEWETPQGGGMKTAGTGGGITGRGGDLILVDDPIKDWAEAYSPTYQERLIDWFESTLLTRLEPNGTVIILMTRWAQSDLTGHLMEKHPRKWDVVSLPAIAEYGDPMGRLPGVALCPERFDEQALLNIKESVGTFKFEAMYQQHPSPPSGMMIRREWLKYYTVLPAKFDDMIQSWDLSFGSTEDNASFVVGQIWGRLGAQRYLVEQYRAKIGFTEQIAVIKAMQQKYPEARTILIENKANGLAVIDALKKQVPGVLPFSPTEYGSKENRLLAASPFIEAGNILLPQNAPWVQDYVEELCTFPSSKHDDQVDATSQALIRFSKKTPHVMLF